MRVFDSKSVYHQVAETLGKTLGKAEVQLTNSIGVRSGNLCKRTSPEYEVGQATPVAPAWAEAVTDQLLLHGIDGIFVGPVFVPTAEAFLTPNFASTPIVFQCLSQ